MKETRPYEYSFEDRSILLRLAQKPLFEPLVRALPRRLTPNQITVAGQLAAGAGFLLAALGRPLPPAGCVLLAGLVLFYIVADCIDGLFARHTQRTSRLGEMLDHWLDAASVPLVILSLVLVLPASPWLVMTTAVITTSLHFATFLHGFRVGFVHLGAIGVIEGSCVGALLCVAMAFVGDGWLAHEVAGGWSVASLLVVALVAGSVATLGCMRGLVRHLRDFVPLGVLLAVVVAWYAWGRLSPAIGGTLAIAVGARLEGEVIRARLTREPLVLFDAGLLALIGLAAGVSLGRDLDASAQALAAAVPIAYAVWRGARSFWWTAGVLRAPAGGSTARQPGL